MYCEEIAERARKNKALRRSRVYGAGKSADGLPAGCGVLRETSGLHDPPDVKRRPCSPRVAHRAGAGASEHKTSPTLYTMERYLSTGNFPFGSSLWNLIIFGDGGRVRTGILPHDRGVRGATTEVPRLPHRRVPPARTTRPSGLPTGPRSPLPRSSRRGEGYSQ